MQEIIRYLKEKAPLIDERIRKFLPKEFDRKYLEWAFGKPRYSPDLDALDKSLAEPIWDFLDRGGKRWRPALFLLVSEALGADPEKVMDFVIVPELAHNGSIMIDDIEDMGEMRRGKPCTHKLFGTDTAINAGNFMYFLPALVFIKNRETFDQKTLVRAQDIFMQEMVNIHLGQAMDIWWHKGHAKGLSEDQYMQMCAYKTGTLARLAARLAVALAGGTPEQEEKIGHFAESLGVGFQIQDDVLSASGGEFSRKKGFGDDITEGKRTLIVLHALKNLPKKDAARLNEILNMHTRDSKPIKEALGLLKKSGSVEYAKERARALVKKTWEEASRHIPDSKAKEMLAGLTAFAAEREI